MGSNNNLISEGDLDKLVSSGQLEPTESTPIVPGAPPQGQNPYLSGSIPPSFQYAPDLLKTDYQGGRVPVERLMPVAPAGVPSVNSATHSTVRSIVEQTVNTVNNTDNQFIELETNSIPNANQEVLNLKAGPGLSVASTGDGSVTYSGTTGFNYQEIEGEGTPAPPEPILNFEAPIIVTDNAGIATNVQVPVMVGDSGAGGVAGLAPAPGAGAAAAGKYLKADGTYEVPPGTGGAAFYQTVELNTVSKPQEPNLNFSTAFTVTDNPGNSSTDIGLVATVVAVDLTNQSGDVLATTIATPSANGYYRVSAWQVVTTQEAASTLPSVLITFNDADTNVIKVLNLLATTPGTSLAVFSPPGFTGGAPQWAGTMYAKSGAPIQYTISGYSGSALRFALHLRLEGPF